MLEINITNQFINNLQDLRKAENTLKDCSEKVIELCEYKVFISDIASLKNKVEKLGLELIKNNSLAIKFVKNKTKRICKESLTKNGLSLQFVKYQDDELCKIALRQNPNSFIYVKNQNEKLCEFALKRDGLLLQYVKNQNEKLCCIAIYLMIMAKQLLKTIYQLTVF